MACGTRLGLKLIDPRRDGIEAALSNTNLRSEGQFSRRGDPKWRARVEGYDRYGAWRATTRDRPYGG